jgi:hypothetical protein
MWFVLQCNRAIASIALIRLPMTEVTLHRPAIGLDLPIIWNDFISFEAG